MFDASERQELMIYSNLQHNSLTPQALLISPDGDVMLLCKAYGLVKAGSNVVIKPHKGNKEGRRTWTSDAGPNGVCLTNKDVPNAHFFWARIWSDK